MKKIRKLPCNFSVATIFNKSRHFSAKQLVAEPPVCTVVASVSMDRTQITTKCTIVTQSVIRWDSSKVAISGTILESSTRPPSLAIASRRIIWFKSTTSAGPGRTMWILKQSLLTGRSHTNSEKAIQTALLSVSSKFSRTFTKRLGSNISRNITQILLRASTSLLRRMKAVWLMQMLLHSSNSMEEGTEVLVRSCWRSMNQVPCKGNPGKML